MSAQVFFDERWDVYRVRDERGRVMADGNGYQLAFDDRHAAEDMLARRAALFAIPARSLRECQ